MRSSGINGEGELRGQPANPGSPGKWPLKRSVCYLHSWRWLYQENVSEKSGWRKLDPHETYFRRRRRSGSDVTSASGSDAGPVCRGVEVERESRGWSSVRRRLHPGSAEAWKDQVDEVGMVSAPPGKFWKVPEFSPVFQWPGKFCKSMYVLESCGSFMLGPGKYLNLLCFKLNKFALRFECDQLKNCVHYLSAYSGSSDQDFEKSFRDEPRARIVRDYNQLDGRPCYPPNSVYCTEGSRVSLSG